MAAQDRTQSSPLCVRARRVFTCECVWCAPVCLRSSKTLPEPPVFVFALRAPLHFAFTEGKPCVKMQLAPFPQQDTQHKEQTQASTAAHSALLHVKLCHSRKKAISCSCKRCLMKIRHFVFVDLSQAECPEGSCECICFERLLYLSL